MLVFVFVFLPVLFIVFSISSNTSHMFYSSFNKVHWLDSSIGRRHCRGGVVYSLTVLMS